jgi:hypothetical protein
MNLGYYGSYIYWIIEILIVAGITFVMVKQASAEPYCTDCDQWKVPRVLGFLAGDATSATAAVRSGDLNAIRSAGPTLDPTPPLRLTAATCAGCPQGHGMVDVKLETIAADSKGNVKAQTLAHTRYPGESLAHLQPL